jgi:hypothetical protein
MGAYTTPDLVTASDLVVRGRVESESSRWDRSRKRILTEVVVLVADTWKGAATPGVVVRQLGGTIDGIAMRVIGTARLTLGEEVVLFLARIPVSPELKQSAARPVYRIVGMSQGKLSVVRLPGKPAQVRFDPDGLALRGAPQVAERSLANLRAQVRAQKGGR